MLHLDALAKVLPVLLVIGLGAALRRARLLGGGAAGELKRLVVGLTLPALLFLAFARLEAEVRTLALVAAVYLACLAALLLGRLLQPLTGIRARSFPMLLTGFEAGMMGYALSATVYGQASLRRFALVDLGQVLFVFSALVPALQRSSGGPPPLRARLSGFARSPVVLAIAAGLLAGQSGLLRALEGTPGASGLVEAVALVGGMTTPLVALLIGYDLRLELRGLGRPALALGLRLLFWIPAGLAIAELVVRRWLGLDRSHVAALMLLVVLPPPFVIPLFLPKEERGEVDFTVRTLALSTVVSLAAVTAVALLFPA
jgi:malate permease and related proteins